jgi:hypothetical protein
MSIAERQHTPPRKKPHHARQHKMYDSDSCHHFHISAITEENTSKSIQKINTADRVKPKDIFTRTIEAANHDFCPWAEAYVRWLRHPLAWLIIAAVVSLLAGMTISIQGYVICAAISTFIVFGIAWPWITMRGICCSVHLKQQRCQEDDFVVAELAIINKWPWSWMLPSGKTTVVSAKATVPKTWPLCGGWRSVS